MVYIGTTGFSLAALSSATNPPASSATAAPVLGFGGAATTSGTLLLSCLSPFTVISLPWVDRPVSTIVEVMA